MKINHNHPSFDDFKKNEVKTLQYINARGLILKDFPELLSKIQQSYNENKGKVSKNNFNFIFHADFNMSIEGSQHRVILGANLEGNYSLCSYFLAVVGKGPDSAELIRKFHFDYALPPVSASTKIKQPSPIYHLQYGGKPSPEITALGINDNKIDHWLSLPRLIYSPVNFAILLDILFCEFRTEETHKIVENPDWRALIFNNENFLTKSYYAGIRDHMVSGGYKKENLVRDFCYGS